MGCPPDHEPGVRYYARASARVRASIADSMLFLVALCVLLLVFELGDTPGVVAIPIFYGWAVALVLYEPVLVSRRGATIGHTLHNLVVRDVRTGRPPSLPKAIARTLLKGVLGLPSFVAMSLTRRHQAVHDIATGTVVEIADLARARPSDIVVKGGEG